MSLTRQTPTAAVIGGGLAGLSAAASLCELGFRVRLFEARQRLGGRAGSFQDGQQGEPIDHCQHVGMGCCTNLADFCRRLGLQSLFRRDRLLHFFSPDGRRCDFRASRWLPAPLHLASALWGLKFLSAGERIGIARALTALARTPSRECDSQTVGEWLERRRQSPRQVRRFWAVVLVSALGESLDRASLAAARKVFVDGFLSHRDAYAIDVPTVSLGELYGERMAGQLEKMGVELRTGEPVTALIASSPDSSPWRIEALELADAQRHSYDYYVSAVPWRRLERLFEAQGADLADRFPALEAARRIDAAPITGVHMWFDRQFTDLPHAVLVDRLSQWVFQRPAQASDSGGASYLQVVISASRDLAGRSREQIIEEVLGDLATVFPKAADARLLRFRIVTQRDAVFSVRPGLDAIRPSAETPLANLALAGDWINTGWPSTMEGAVRSGRMAAEAIARAEGRRQDDGSGNDRRLVVPDLPRGRLARMLIRD